MNYEKFSQSQLIAELQKRDEQITQLQETSFSTNIKLNQQFLRQRESKLEESQKVAKLGHYSFDVQQGIWTNSEQLNVLFEIDENYNRDVEGWLKIVHPDFAETMQNHLMVDVIQNKKPFNKVYKIITFKSKTEKWVHGNGKLAFNEKGEPVEMFGTIQDITERKVVEEALEERESKLKESQKVAKLGYYSFNILTGLWTNSEQLDEIFEIDENFQRDVEGWLKIIHADFVESMQNHLMVDVIQNKKPFNKEYKIITINKKKEKWVYGKGNLKFDEKGKAIEMFGTIQDITERKLIEEALQDSEAKLRKLFDKSMDAIFVVDLNNGNYIDANKSAEELTGYSVNEIKNLKTNDLTPSESGKRIKNLSQFKNVVDFGEVEYCRKDGTKRIANLATIPISNKYIYGIAHDITNQRKIENEILEARNKAQASDKMKSEFLAQMSHEIRSPINVIVSFLSLIKEETSDMNNEIVESSFSSIESSTNRIIRTIDMILNMSDLQLGTYSPTSNEIEIKELLKILFNEYKNVAVSKNLELKLNVDVKNDKIYTDDYAFKQIVANLIDNALKYTNTGFIEIRLAESETEFLIEIVDTGIGISEEFLPDIFSSFSQETKGYTRKFDGTGLGLALVKKYCNLINADIKVNSIKDKGSTFSLHIPKK